MAAGYVQVATDGPGKKTQTFVNTIEADSVHAEGVVLVDSAGVERTTFPVSQLAATNPASTTMQNAATGTGNGTLLNVQGYASAILAINSTGSATIQFEASVNDALWTSILGYLIGAQSGAAAPFASSAPASTVANYRFDVAGFKSMRARISAYVSPSITVTGYACALSGEVIVSQSVARLIDGAVSATIRPSGSAAQTSDTSLVVALNPNSPVVQTKSTTGTQTSVANSVSSVTVLASNTSRFGATIFNDDTAVTGATLKIKFGSTASATSFVVAVAPQGYFEVPFNYNGIITGIASAATGNARVTELT